MGAGKITGVMRGESRESWGNYSLIERGFKRELGKLQFN